MKAITMRIQKFSRPGVILMAIVVVIITSMVAANATQTITAPNAAFISYSLASLSNSAPITLATNRSVLVMGCCTTASVEGVGQVSLLHVPSTKIVWFGLDNNPSTTATIHQWIQCHAGNPHRVHRRHPPRGHPGGQRRHDPSPQQPRWF